MRKRKLGTLLPNAEKRCDFKAENSGVYLHIPADEMAHHFIGTNLGPRQDNRPILSGTI